MRKIKNIVFDLGGVFIDFKRDEAVRRFTQIGVKNAEDLIHPYEQKGIFLEIENGKVDSDTFCSELSKMAGRNLTYEEIYWAWLGFIVDVPRCKLDFVWTLKDTYHLYLLSNTNPIIQEWAQSDKFSEAGKPLGDYFEKLYLSYQVGVTKPNRHIFDYMIEDSGIIPEETLFVDDSAANIEVGKTYGLHTFQPLNGSDWRADLSACLVDLEK